MSSTTTYGYLLVHFVQDEGGYGERIYFSLSEGDDPLRWWRANHGEPVLTSALGTTGVRDPHLVRGDGEFFLIATDLRVYGGDNAGWDAWTRTGSRSIVVWRSTDLVHWSEPWLAEVAPANAGMAWAPESSFDPETGEYQVYWSSALYADDDPGHTASSYSRVLLARTRDFRSFTEPTVIIDHGRAVIDTTVARAGLRVHRFSKEDSRLEDSIKLFHEAGSAIGADDFQVLATRIADVHPDVEGPLIFCDHSGRWYLWVDQYSSVPQGYLALTTEDLDSGKWRLLPATDFQLPAATKHGVVLPLIGDEWERLRAAYPS